MPHIVHGRTLEPRVPASDSSVQHFREAFAEIGYELRADDPYLWWAIGEYRAECFSCRSLDLLFSTVYLTWERRGFPHPEKP